MSSPVSDPDTTGASGDILVLRAPNNKVQVGTALEPAHLCSEVAILDTGAGPNCVRRARLPAGWETGLLDAPAMRVRDANRNPLPVNCVISLYVQLGTTLVKGEFWCAKSSPFLSSSNRISSASLFSELCHHPTVGSYGSKVGERLRPFR